MRDDAPSADMSRTAYILMLDFHTFLADILRRYSNVPRRTPPPPLTLPAVALLRILVENLNTDKSASAGGGRADESAYVYVSASASAPALLLHALAGSPAAAEDSSVWSLAIVTYTYYAHKNM